MTKVRYLMASSFVALAITAGCSNEPPGPPTYPLTGTVTLDGEPLEAADVVFSPSPGSGGKAAQAMTDAEGKFEVSTHVGGGNYKVGVLPGSYGVTISKLESVGERESMGAPPKNLLPSEYDNPRDPKWTIEVSAEPKQANFELNSKGR